MPFGPFRGADDNAIIVDDNWLLRTVKAAEAKQNQKRLAKNQREQERRAMARVKGQKMMTAMKPTAAMKATTATKATTAMKTTTTMGTATGQKTMSPCTCSLRVLTRRVLKRGRR